MTDSFGIGCFGYDLNSLERCYGQGECVHASLCKCEEGYTGGQCEWILVLT